MTNWQSANETALLSVQRKAMNDEFEVLFSRQAFPQGTAAALNALDDVGRIEKVLSVFRFDSRIQFINLTAHERPVQTDAELFSLLSLCQQIAAETEGAVDITSGCLWKVWGFAKRQGKFPEASELEKARQQTGYRFMELNAETRSVRFTKPGMELNLGCVGKGFALDTAAGKLREQAVDRFMFCGGLSSILTAGSDWKIGIAHPLLPGKRLRELGLSDIAVSTSGSQKQFFRHGSRRYSHLIDPRTGEPAEGVLSATVLAPTATLAELLSTAFFILGAEKAAEYCRLHSGISAILTIPAKKSGGFETVELMSGETFNGQETNIPRPL
ncbi:MAG: FAD:protein FMN transferase [Planctomycetaceae bacterium]|jgi:thiamine biosynthesis lipoprotein|nr:FAD:protein FMN transferase [Planctomycetaceae bacterium]